ncbi:MAG: hypothetical protein ACRC7C_19835 [Beijerinckiaceae bacterium]
MSELEKTVSEILIKATNAAEAAGAFALQQLPDIAQQYVRYTAIQSAITATACVLILVAAAFALRWQFKWISAWQRSGPYEDNERSYSLIPSGFLLLIGGPVVLIILANSLKTFVLATVAPKILLIQWAAELVK